MNDKGRQRRTVRLRQSVILRLDFDNINSFCLKWAETRDELAKAFTLVYEEYAKSGYTKNGRPSNMFFNLHHLLPETAVLIMKDKENIISTLSLVTDSEHFGLPMDTIYREEIDALRRRNLRVMEFSALATSDEYRLKNIIMYLFRQSYWHAVENNIQEICIMINPRHIRFYKTILLFKDFGPEKLYSRVNAPAVALRLNVDTYPERLKESYGEFDPKYNLYSFLCQNQELSAEARRLLFNMESHHRVGYDVLKYFIERLSKDQRKDYMEMVPESADL